MDSGRVVVESRLSPSWMIREVVQVNYVGKAANLYSTGYNMHGETSNCIMPVLRFASPSPSLALFQH